VEKKGRWTERLRRRASLAAERLIRGYPSMGARHRAGLLEPRETSMTPLRLRMIEDMKSAGLAPRISEAPRRIC